MSKYLFRATRIVAIATSAICAPHLTLGCIRYLAISHIGPSSNIEAPVLCYQSFRLSLNDFSHYQIIFGDYSYIYVEFIIIGCIVSLIYDCHTQNEHLGRFSKNSCGDKRSNSCRDPISTLILGGICEAVHEDL